MIRASLTAELARHTAWPLDRIKDHSSKIGSGITPTGGAASYLNAGVPLLRSQNVHFDGLRLDDVAFIGEDTHAEMAGTQLKAGDVLLNITGASIGRCTFIPEGFGEGNVNQHVCIIRPSASLYHRFLTYCLAAPWGQDQILSSFTGASRQGLGQRDLGEIQIPLPTRPEQERIVAYLDTSCAAIDGAIRAKQQQLGVLDQLRKSIIHRAVTRGLDEQVELKDSGVQWLGQVPRHWSILPFKRVFKTIYRYPTYYDIEYVDGGIPEIRGEALGDDGTILKLISERYIAPETNDQFPQTQLELGDIVMSVRGTMGKIGLVDKRYIGANITANLLRLSPKKGIASGHFLRWLFLSHYFAECLVATSPQTTIKTVTMPQLATIRLAIPPVPEQLQISEYLEEEVHGIGDLKKNLTNQITALEQYRKSLIHECVTGKRRIAETDLESKIREIVS